MKERWGGGDSLLGFSLLSIRIEMLFSCCAFFILHGWGDGGCYNIGMGCYYELFRVFIVIYIQKVILSGEEISCINDILNNLDRKNVPVCEVNIYKRKQNVLFYNGFISHPCFI